MNTIVSHIFEYQLARKYLRGDGLFILAILLLPLVSGFTNISFEGSMGMVAGMLYALGCNKLVWQPIERYRKARRKSFFRWVVLPFAAMCGFFLAFPLTWVVGSLMRPDSSDNLLWLLYLWYGVQL